MKRCYLGAGLLVVLLGIGCLSSWWMGRHHNHLAGELHRATELAVAGETEQAVHLTRQARRNWEKNRGLSASLADHEPMEHVDSLFDQLETYASVGESIAFAGCCAQLASELEAMADESRFTWWNLL